MKVLLLALIFATISCTTGERTSKSLPDVTSDLLGPVTYIETGGNRSGEGYFSADGEWMVFQSEQTENPFYQIYLMEFPAGKPRRISNNVGKTTCSWIDPKDGTIIFSSTHKDPKSAEKQAQEVADRKNPKRRYAWDYDENYDIYRFDRSGKELAVLSPAKGYDAEGSMSPDGQWIVFASNRHAYSEKLSPEEQVRLQEDASYFLDIYVMKRNGTGLRRLTFSPGYDGGPFFSPDGKRIVWRRFSADGRTAEVYTMNSDGSDQRQITRMNAMSWAPFYHPSGDYIIFTSSVFGHHNFELFIIDKDGEKDPVRVTHSEGFDGLPVFTPDGETLTWNRKLTDGTSRIVKASWNDAAARQKLGLPPRKPAVRNYTAAITASDVKTTVEFLASRELNGRATGSPGEAKAIAAYEEFFRDLGLTAPFNGNYKDDFEFVREAQMTSQNELILLGDSQRTLTLGQDWQPLSLSKSGHVSAGEVVFGGYGIRVPESAGFSYNSYNGLDVKNKWVMIFRYWPEQIEKKKAVELQRYARLEHKIALLKDAGAKGAIVISGPNANARQALIPFQKNAAASSGIPAITITDDTAEQILNSTGKSLKELQTEYDRAEAIAGFQIEKYRLSAAISIHYEKGKSQNVAGLLKVPGAKRTLIIGAHGDHLGDNPQGETLRRSTDKETIHFGADDNASGVAAVLEVAHKMSVAYRNGELPLKQNILFAIWSGEERGNLGSARFVEKRLKRLNPSAYINMDMIGRWPKDPTARKPLNVQGIGSSAEWKNVFSRMKFQWPMNYQEDPYLPTDAMSFYVAKVPVINFFTGAHEDYHTPRDTAEKISHWGIVDVATIVEKAATIVATGEVEVKYKEYEAPKAEKRRGFRIYLGTIPDYSGSSGQGVKLSGVISGGPAERAGLKSGDIIIELDQKKIENINDYVFTLEGVKPGQETTVVVLRNGEKKSLSITPSARE